MRSIDFGLNSLIDKALAEDISKGDATTDLLLPADLRGRAAVVSRSNGVLAGVDFALAVFQRLDKSLSLNRILDDGVALSPGNVVAEIEGSLTSILKAERTAINIIQHMSGIATHTREYVNQVEGYKARILDTRKTTVGLRYLEKYAVRAGGGNNHRFNLGESILIKDNHITALRAKGLGIGDIVKKALTEAADGLKVEIEVESVSEFKEVFEAGAKNVLLDNMNLDDMLEVVTIARGKVVVEASGGITLANVRDVAKTGVDFISVGALTHSSDALDMSLELT